jgi:hypothetical protein
MSEPTVTVCLFSSVWVLHNSETNGHGTANRDSDENDSFDDQTPSYDKHVAEHVHW